jgi:ATP-binding cassette, subfamily B, multidrug efflux pump
MWKQLRHLRPYARLVVAALSLTFVNALADLYLPTLMARMVDSGVTKGDTGTILRMGGRMLLVVLGSVCCYVGSTYLSSRISMAFGRDLRRRIFSKVAGFSLDEFDRFGAATLITRTSNDVTQVQIFVMMMFRMMVAAPLMCIGGIIMALSMDRHLSVVLLAAVPLLVVVLAFIAIRGVGLFKAMQRKLDRLSLVLRELLDGVRVIRAFNRVTSEQARFGQANRDLTLTALAAQRTVALLMPAMMLAMNFTALAIIWVGGHRVAAGSIQVGTMMAFLQYAMQILFSLIMVSIMFVLLPRASVSAGRLEEVLSVVPEIKDPDVPGSPRPAHGRVDFKEVVFRYPGAEAPALEGITFSALPGEVTAIVGGTGSGKSTLAGLIPRFYDVESGSVAIDGIDVRHLRQRELRRSIGFVPQKAVLFSDTIANNIRYGKEDATDDEVRRAAVVAQLDDFIAGLPAGYAASVAQAGVNLSGGQKQRLAIARALVRRPPIYVFDDSFSALDFKTDAGLRRALAQETRDAAVIIVAQRISTVMDADRIVVLDDGKVVGIGKHDALMRDCPVYREIVNSQLSSQEAA